MSDVFSDDNIAKFVAAWYLALDNHVSTSEITAYVTDDVQMIFPEKTLPNLHDFACWYAGGTYTDGTPAPGVINIFFDENHNVVSVETVKKTADSVDVKVVVAWQASWFVPPATKAKRTSLDATQAWTLVKSDKNPFGIAVSSYNAVAAPFAYAPGFARL